jgi:hypothetical protein
MKSSSTILRVLLVFVAICFIQMVAGIVVPMKTVLPPHSMRWLLLMNAVVAAALTFVAANAEWRGWRLGAALAAIPLVIASVNLLEGVVFLTNSQLEWGRIFVYTLVSAVLIIPVWMLLFGRRNKPPQEHFHPIASKSRGERAWKFAVSDLTYIILYYGTGMIIFPYVKGFYATQHIPPLGTIVALQLLIRGPVFVLLCLSLTRILNLPRLSGAIAVGIVFTLLSGVAPLLIPNPVFPDSVRWVHFCEVTSENFVFGAIVAWLWGRPKPEPGRIEAMQRAV